MENFDRVNGPLERLNSTTCMWTSTCITSSSLRGHMVYFNCTNCIRRVGRRLQVQVLTCGILTSIWRFYILIKCTIMNN